MAKRPAINLDKVPKGDQLVVTKSFDGAGVPCSNQSTMFGVRLGGEPTNLFIMQNNHTNDLIDQIGRLPESVEMTIYCEESGYTLSTSQNGVKTPTEDVKVDTGGNTAPDWELINNKKTFDIHIQVAAKLAAATMPEKWSSKTAAQRTDQWFSIISDHFGRIKAHIQTAESPIHLKGIAEKYGKVWRDILTDDELTEIMAVYDVVRDQLNAQYEAARDDAVSQQVQNEDASRGNDSEEDDLPF